jgi:hypothetical protein
MTNSAMQARDMTSRMMCSCFTDSNLQVNQKVGFNVAGLAAKHLVKFSSGRSQVTQVQRAWQPDEYKKRYSATKFSHVTDAEVVQ